MRVKKMKKETVKMNQDDNESRGGTEEDKIENELNDHEQTGESTSNNDYVSCEESEESPQRYRLRDRNTLKKPKAYEDYEWNLMSLAEEDEPLTYHEAVTSNESKMWKKAIKEEIEALKENDTWTVIKRPEHCEPIDSKWVFKKKRNEKGDIVKYKARLVARGFFAKECILF